jgi:hypothetical protein
LNNFLLQNFALLSSPFRPKCDLNKDITGNRWKLKFNRKFWVEWKYKSGPNCFWLFVLFYSRLSNFSAIQRLSSLPVTGLRILDLCLPFMTFSSEGSFSCYTRDLGLFGLIRRTGTHVSQWDSNRGRKDHQGPGSQNYLTTKICLKIKICRKIVIRFIIAVSQNLIFKRSVLFWTYFIEYSKGLETSSNNLLSPLPTILQSY